MVKVILLPVRLVYRGVKLKDLIAICLYSIVAWLCCKDGGKGFFRNPRLPRQWLD